MARSWPGGNDLGLPANLDRVTAISAGPSHAMALLESGVVIAWGRNGDGEASPPLGLRARQPETAQLGSLQVTVQASDGRLSDNAVITINLTTTPNRDSDGDGLLDEVETGTGIFLSAQNTGTDPNNPDSDGDGWNDGDEVNLGFLPTSAGSAPDSTAMISAVRSPGGPLQALQVTFAARSGRTYRIEESPDLQDWVVRETGITGNGVIITRQVPARGVKGFVRVREE